MRLFKLAKEKVWLDELTKPHGHSCWRGRKATKQTNDLLFQGQTYCQILSVWLVIHILYNECIWQEGQGTFRIVDMTHG